MEEFSPRLEQRVLDPHAVVEITNEEFDTLVISRNVLIDALAFEQRFELLLGNYLDFEVGATRLSLETIAGVDYRTYLPGAKALLEANRLLMNLMTAARMYIDQVKQDFKNFPLDESFEHIACGLFADQYDAHIEYRFMEALRNHAQHRGLPAHGYSAADGLHEALSFRCMKHELEKAGGFKRNILDEMPAQVDLRGYARRYAEALSSVHVALRMHVSSVVENARETIAYAIERYKAANNGQALGLHVGRAANGAETWTGLMVEWDDVRLHLAEKNRSALRFTARTDKVVSGKGYR